MTKHPTPMILRKNPFQNAFEIIEPCRRLPCPPSPIPSCGARCSLQANVVGSITAVCREERSSRELLRFCLWPLASNGWCGNRMNGKRKRIGKRSFC